MASPSVTEPQAGQPRSTAASVSSLRPVESTAIPDFLQLLARAVQQHHTYPPSSPMCRAAIEATQRGLLQVGREQLSFRVEPGYLIADEHAVGRGTLIEQEVARRLHAAAIAQVTIEQTVSARELAHFAVDLIACSQRGRPVAGLIEVLAEHGVDRIGLLPAHRPEVLSVHEPEATTTTLLEQQRERREQLFAGGGPVDYLYPAGKGWVRLDPANRLPSVSLVDLALLADSPASLARMLVSLTDDDPAEGTANDALSQKFSDVAMLFSALDPHLARVMFSRLARAVLDLDTEHRQALLRKTILPSLLDGRIDGTVLRDFPDVDLVESLCLLLDLETAAPEVVSTALARLNLPAEREAAVVPLIEARLQNRPSSRPQDLGLEAHARRLVRIDQDRSRSFAEFAAFDLSLNDDEVRMLADIRDRIATTDLLLDQLACLWRLARLEPNPEAVQRFVAHAEPLLADLQRQERWIVLADWLERYRELVEALRESRPDVAEVIAGRLSAMCTPAQARALVALAVRDDESRLTVNRIIAALGADIGPALLDALEPRGGEGRDPQVRGAVQTLCEHAKLVAPALASRLDHVDGGLARVIARVLGIAGAGYETAIAAQLAHSDEQTVREALRSLARIGTPQAASLVGEQVRKRRDWVSSAAEQTLWHFPPVEAQREVRSLLFTRDFVLHQPHVAARLLDRTAQQSGTSGLEAMLGSIAPLRYRFWNPSLMRLGRKAKALLNP